MASGKTNGTKNGQVNGVSKWSWKEIEIKTPTGLIVGKDWRNYSTEDDDADVYIALHGWQDNSGTFDAVIPLLRLRNHLRIVAIDLPGHGLSSHCPKGIYSDLSFAIDVMRVARFLNLTDDEALLQANGREPSNSSNGTNYCHKKRKVNLMGHSMGGYLSVYFASLFPELVNTVIVIDILKPLTNKKDDDLSKMAAKSVLSFISLENHLNKADYSEKPYTWNAAVDRLIVGHSKIGKLTRDAAEILLRRGSKIKCNIEDEDGNKMYAFTRDPRLHALFFSRLDVSTVKKYVMNLKCKLYVIKARDGIKLDEDDVTREFIRQYQEVCQEFRFIFVDGDHHVHLCQPENVSPILQRIFSSDTKTLDNVFDSLFSETENGKEGKQILNVDDVVGQTKYRVSSPVARERD